MTNPAKLRLVPHDAEAIVALPQPPRAWSTGHDVQFYESEEFLYGSVASFLVDGVRAGQPIVVIATEVHRRHFADYMRGTGVDIDTLLHGRDVVWLDARETLNAFMEGPTPSRELFQATVGAVFEKLMENRKY